MNIITVPINQVVPWEKNPRGILKADYEDLKEEIRELGVYKPLIVYQENGRYVVLGGNMRIRALRELGHEEVDISVVEPKSEAEKIKYALSDNDRKGFYEEEKLAELLMPHLEEINLEVYKVDIGESINLKELWEQFGPSQAEDSLEQKITLPDPPQDVLEFAGRFEHIVVEFSGGKDSLLALLWTKNICEKLERPFEARFVETGAEFPDLVSYICRFCKDQKITFRLIMAKQNIVEHYVKKGKWPDTIFRDCQHRFINEVLDSATATPADKTLKIRGGRPEQKVARTPKAAYTTNAQGFHLYAPYYEMPLTEYAELLKKVQPLLWPGYAQGFKRTACWICPFQTPEQWEAMRKYYPPLWEEMRILSQRLKYPRHAGDSTIRRFWRYWNKFR